MFRDIPELFTDDEFREVLEQITTERMIQDEFNNQHTMDVLLTLWNRLGDGYLRLDRNQQIHEINNI
jgi:hypothetical protein